MCLPKYIYIYFFLRPYFVQNKYVPNTNIYRPRRGPTALPPGGASQFANLWYSLLGVLEVRGFYANTVQYMAGVVTGMDLVDVCIQVSLVSVQCIVRYAQNVFR
jgi:hypothetical protein